MNDSLKQSTQSLNQFFTSYGFTAVLVFALVLMIGVVGTLTLVLTTSDSKSSEMQNTIKTISTNFDTATVDQIQSTLRASSDASDASYNTRTPNPFFGAYCSKYESQAGEGSTLSQQDPRVWNMVRATCPPVWSSYNG